MAEAIVDEKTLKVTLDNDGLVWVLNGDGIPQPTKCDTEAFLKSWRIEANERIRLPGTAQNAKLIVELYEQRLRGAFDSLQVCSPLCCESADERKDPAVVLLSMRQFSPAKSLGGWHEFGLKDLPSYMMAAHFFKHDDATPETLMLLRGHPAYSALSFAACLDEQAIARLIGTVIDPRWYVDPNDPDRNSRYEQFLCLNPKSVSQANHQDATWRTHKYRLVQDCWQIQEPEKELLKCPAPRLFIWRAFYQAGCNIKGDLTASKHFAHFVRQVWTQAVYNGPGPERLFVPKYFFFRDDEVKAYEEYMAEQKLKQKDDHV